MPFLRMIKPFGFALFSFAAIAVAGSVCFYPDALSLSALRAFSLVVFAAAAVLALRFRRVNVFFLTIFIGSLAFLLSGAIAESFSPREMETIRIAAWFLLPINFVIFSLLEEKPLFSARSLIRLAAVAAQIAAIAQIAKSSAAEAVTAALAFNLIGDGEATFHEPQIALVISAAAAVALCALISISARKTIQTALLFAFISSLLALFFHPLYSVSSAFFAAAAFIVAAGFVHFSYRLAFYDGLTGVLCRRALDEDLAKIDGLCAIAMIDIDFFKRFNDEHGHDAGDCALKMVAAKLLSIRGEGTVYRYGGEEFAVVFIGKNKSQAAPFLEEARERIEAAPFVKRPPRGDESGKKTAKFKLSKSLRLTVSVGAADNEDGAGAAEAIKKADAALYKAKEGGRNRLVLG